MRKQKLEGRSWKVEVGSWKSEGSNRQSKVGIRKLLFCLLTSVFCLLLTLSPAFGQKIINVPGDDSTTVSIPNAPMISDIEWKVLTDAMEAENWNTAAFYASGLLGRLKVDNEQKQIARLRYFYLFSLAGKIMKFHDEGKTADEADAWQALDKAIDPLIGKEFVLPPRIYRNSCDKALNYVCKVTGNEKTYRTAATNKDGTGILSFDYVNFDKTIDLKTYLEKQVFLGGTLKKVEFNDDLTNPWVMYLIFEKGYVRVVVNE
jgi:hypothetical protein